VPEPHDFFDNTEYWFHSLFAFPIKFLAFFGFQAMLHLRGVAFSGGAEGGSAKRSSRL
jgi:hypothetical protein